MSISKELSCRMTVVQDFSVSLSKATLQIQQQEKSFLSGAEPMKSGKVLF